MNTLEAIKQRHESGYHVFREIDEVSLMYLDIHWLIDELERAKPVLDAAEYINERMSKCNSDNWFFELATALGWEK